MLGLGVQDGPERYSNSVLGFGPAYAQQAYRYDKHHLVPFGEFVPFGFRWFVQMLKIPLGDFSGAGLLQAPMRVKDQWVMANVCYEDLFGEEIAEQLKSQTDQQGTQISTQLSTQLSAQASELNSHPAAVKPGVASILLNVSNLAWYGDSIAIPQHLQISQMRVLETGRPMLRSTNTGATAVILPGGEIVSQLKALTQDSLSVRVQGMQGMTPYILWGNFGILSVILVLIWSVYWTVRKQKSS